MGIAKKDLIFLILLIIFFASLPVVTYLTPNTTLRIILTIVLLVICVCGFLTTIKKSR